MSVVITKCDQNLLQRLVGGITKCDRKTLQSTTGITKCNKKLIKSATGNTKCDKLQRETKHQCIFEKGRHFVTSMRFSLKV